jgi:RimJ/RimL family protein N-acetyltransferase
MSAKPSGAFLPGIAPPERLDLGDLVVRRFRPDDLMVRFDAVTKSYPALHQWMEWASEPITLERLRARAEAMEVSWPDPDGACGYGIFGSGGAMLGAIGLHDNIGLGGLEIGYWCHIEHVGRGIITRSVGALTDIALVLPGIERVEIHCDEANRKSQAVPRRLGYHVHRVERRPVRTPAESGVGMVWIKAERKESYRSSCHAT